MKLVFMTNGDGNNIFDVFHTITVPNELAPPQQIDRWRSIIQSCPIQPLVVQGKPNLFLGSIYDQESESFTLADENLKQYEKSPTAISAVFLIDNIVVGTVGIGSIDHNHPNTPMLMSAYSSPVTIVELEDDSDVILGYTWDGTTFYPPLT